MRIEHKYYSLLFINIAMVLLLVMFIYQRGGLQYIEAKLEQVRQGESIAAQTQKIKSNKCSMFDRLPASKNDIIMIGDSITEYMHWTEFLNDLRVKTRGIGGETSTGMLEWYKLIANKKPAQLFLLVGINNFKKGFSEEALQQYLKDINFFCANTPKQSQLNIISILPINETKAKNFIKCTNYEIKRINNELEKEVIKYANARFIDCYGHLTDPVTNQLDPNLTFDGVHLNYKGYRKYAAILSPYID